ncbi:MAG TPA: vanadium-dependent haloperoxidase [Chitinophagaceae bacterium]|nr:vanadium-dependent haloperoxidase [Chitinophagaceae bacterium]MCB9054809.1 vanadium-dependent haloperoxidase [Chitinophagales bacterium]HPG10960.1 vanadium-dependent haloperoxidase [Chitinophagaceae bacterium]HRX93678.1 vanadium-dependent haloperoxidase [Chitinophagaceae bacterium]
MRRIIIFLPVTLLLITACNKKENYKDVIHNPELYSDVVHELNTVVMGNNFSPIVASRNYMYASVAAYEVIAAGYPDMYESLAGQLHELNANSIPRPDTTKKIDFEMAAIIAFSRLGEAVTFPKGSMSYYIDSIKALAKDHGMTESMLKNSIEYADAVSAVILDWSKTDLYKETRTYPKYNVRDEPGRWVPTPPAYTPAMEPHWNKIRPLVLDSADQFTPPPPPTYDLNNKKGKYYQEVMLIKNAIDSLTKEQKHIADFWDDNPFKLNVSGHIMFGTKKFSPPGHWMSIAGIAAKKANFDFPATVYAYALLAITQFDAFIHCWDEKYRSNYARPETVINKYIDPDWSPYLQTPPFPEYTCGHSTVSAANAEALTYALGDNFAYTDTSELEFGIASRSYKSFRDAAVENNWARFYGGIHFHNSCIISTEYGKKVGDFIITKLKMRKKAGHLSDN